MAAATARPSKAAPESIGLVVPPEPTSALIVTAEPAQRVVLSLRQVATVADGVVVSDADALATAIDETR